jgi:hypothetical protein
MGVLHQRQKPGLLRLLQPESLNFSLRNPVFQVLLRMGQDVSYRIFWQERHRSVFNFMVNLIAGLIAYSYREKKPSLNLSLEEFVRLPAAVF